MKLRIANLGVVQEATIDLSRKLIVFCGPNGTGKTWTAYAIGGFLNMQRPAVFMGEEYDLAPLFATGKIELELSPSDIFEILQNESNYFPGFIQQIFPVKVESQKELFGSFKTEVLGSFNEFEYNYLRQKIKIVVRYAGYNIEVFKESDSLNVNLGYKYTGNEHIPVYDGLAPLLLGGIARALAYYPSISNVVLPVERNSIFTFNKEISLQKAALVERIIKSPSVMLDEFTEFSSSRATRYSEAIRDALETADDIANISRRASPFYDFGVEVEHYLLQGKVGIGEGGEVDFAPSRAEGKSFSFQLSSSAVKTLSSLIIYLKYQAKPNELLIIDEPELNLHPDNQILLARVFARMINKGMRLLISTHSDYIIRELNNLIMLSADTPALQKVAQEFGYRNDERIPNEEVGVYLFHFKSPTDKFVTVEEMPVTETGFEVPTIDAAIRQLNKVSEEIFYTLQDSTEESA